MLSCKETCTCDIIYHQHVEKLLGKLIYSVLLTKMLYKEKHWLQWLLLLIITFLYVPTGYQYSCNSNLHPHQNEVLFRYPRLYDH